MRYQRSTSGRSSSSNLRLDQTSFQSARCSENGVSASTLTSSARSSRSARAREPVELVVDDLLEPALREGERAAQKLLAGREVVVDEGFRDAGLVGYARHAQTVCALAHDDAARGLENRDDAIGLGGWGARGHGAHLDPFRGRRYPD